MSQWGVIDASETRNVSTSYDSYKNIFPRKISTIVLTGISFYTDSIVSE